MARATMNAGYNWESRRVRFSVLCHEDHHLKMYLQDLCTADDRSLDVCGIQCDGVYSLGQAYQRIDGVTQDRVTATSLFVILSRSVLYASGLRVEYCLARPQA